MKIRVLALACAVLVAVPLYAGDGPQARFTGNPRVDLFGSNIIPGSRLMMTPDSGMTGVMEDLTPDDKSPVVAGLLSLAVPGLGELYTKNYVKAAAFFGADVAFWTLAYTYNKRGDRQTSDFQDFANAHWSPVRYINWTLNNLTVLNPGLTHSATEYGNLIYTDGYDPADPPPPSDFHPPYAKRIDWGQLNSMEREIGDYGSGLPNGYTHVLPYYGEQQYFELIGKYDEFSRGWDDANLSPIATSDLPLKNNSPRFVQYQLMRAEANRQYDVSATWVSVAVVNHILSALDAFWSATRYNKNLRAEAHMSMVRTPDGVAPYSQLSLQVGF